MDGIDKMGFMDEMDGVGRREEIGWWRDEGGGWRTEAGWSRWG